MARIDKVVVTNSGALKAKYGSKGAGAISKAITALVAADAKRGITTKLIALDSAAAMRKVSGKPVTNPGDPKQNKDAVDAVFRKLSPDYLVLLGSIDVIPHQDLTNPVKDDDDPIAFGDLPYACSAPYSKRVEDFRGPTRVVGRIPDLTHASDSRYLVKVLNTAAAYRVNTRADYVHYLGITAEVWSKSTALSLQNTFGSSTDLQRVPPKSGKWPASLLQRRSHFINCHGGPGDPHFYGQRGKSYPIAHDAAYLASRVAAGSVVSAECCYGAELYDPAVAAGQMGICSTYLGNGAYGFFGSSTTAYGPSSGNGAADLICQYFLQRILAGSSLGRAALEARQHFVQTMSVLDPADLKTLAQFSLLGDPSIHPVQAELPQLTQTKAYRAAVPNRETMDRALRRERLSKAGIALGHSTGAARYASKFRTGRKARAALEAAARETGVEHLSFASYAVHGPAGTEYREAKARGMSPDAFHVAVARHSNQTSVVPIVLIIATESGGKIVRLRRLHAR